MTAPAVHAGAACASGAAVVHDCATAALPSGWPPLRVQVLYPPTHPGTSAALARAAARQMVRQVLMRQIGTAAATHLLDLPRAARGAQGLSISHEADASLLAWCPTGAVGVDLVDLDSLARARQQDLVATAALYLGPDAAAAVAASPHASEARVQFALHWTRLEARLKCLGLQLEEWQPAQASLLGNTGTVQVWLLECDGQASNRWIACAAWRATAQAGPKVIGKIVQRVGGTIPWPACALHRHGTESTMAHFERQLREFEA